jgi:hypothetical protein
MPSLTLSYAELAAHIGRSEIAARSLAQRKRWKRSPGNDGKVRVTIDEADLAEVAKGDRRSTDHPTDRPPANGAGARVTDRPNPVHELQAKLAVAQALASERERELADLRADREAERQTLRGTVEALKQALEAERLLRDELRRELERLSRPWWRRLAG